MKKTILCMAAFLLLFAVTGIQGALAQDYERVTINQLNDYEEPPQTTLEFSQHPYADQPVEFTAMVVSHPRSSGLANFTAEEDQEDDDLGIGRIHFFVVDTAAYSQGKEGMYMQVVAGDVGAFETLERGDIVDFQGTHDFFSNIVQFDPDNEQFITNVLIGGDANPFAKYRELLEPMTLTTSDINQVADEDGGTYRFRPEAYSDYVNAYVKFEQQQVIASEIDDTGRPSFYWIDEDGIAMQNYDTSLRYRNDRNDAQGGYREGYNFRRVEEDGPFRPPASGSIIDISGYVVWAAFDGFGLDESPQEGALKLVPMEDGVLWWLGERTHEDPNSGEPWPNDLVVLGFPPVIADYELSDTEPDPDETVSVTARITGPDGEAIEDVSLTYNTNRGGTESEAMVNEGDGFFSYEFPVFEDFTAVQFEINARSGSVVDEDTVEVTGTFTDGSLDQLGEPLTMSFMYLGDQITDIETIQRTMDGERGPSPFDAGNEFEKEFGIQIEATVVSGAEDGFVVVHDGSGAWSGLPLASTGDVLQLERGQQITITGGEIANSFNNVFLGGEVSYTHNGTTDDLDPFIPVISIDDARFNEGRAYEGMIVKFEDAVVNTNQADIGTGNDYGEWAFASQEDPDGRILRVRNRLSFAPITEALDSQIPNDLNAHMKAGATLDAIYGFMAHSFGNSKIQLRTLDDLVTDDSFTWPERDIPLFSFTSVGDDAEDPGVSDVIHSTQDNIARWDFSDSYDGDPVTYRFALDTLGGDFSDPLLSKPSDGDGEMPEVTISSSELTAAVAGHLPEDESRNFVWTVFLSDGDGEVQVSDKDGPYFDPTEREVLIQGALVTSSDEERELPETVQLKQNYPNPFNPTTVIEYSVPEDVDVRLNIYDVLGRQVATLVNEHHTPGSYSVNFDASHLASGVYIYRLEAGDVLMTKRMMFVK